MPCVVRKVSLRFISSEMKTEIGPLDWAESNLPADAFTLSENVDALLGRSNGLWDKMGPWIWLPVQLQAALVLFQIFGRLQNPANKELLTLRPLTSLDCRCLNGPFLWRGTRFWSQLCKPGVVDLSGFQWISSRKNPHIIVIKHFKSNIFFMLVSFPSPSV